jgi:hypothetical protein
MSFELNGRINEKPYTKATSLGFELPQPKPALKILKYM